MLYSFKLRLTIVSMSCVHACIYTPVVYIQWARLSYIHVYFKVQSVYKDAYQQLLPSPSLFPSLPLSLPLSPSLSLPSSVPAVEPSPEEIDIISPANYSDDFLANGESVTFKCSDVTAVPVPCFTWVISGNDVTHGDEGISISSGNESVFQSPLPLSSPSHSSSLTLLSWLLHTPEKQGDSLT